MSDDAAHSNGGTPPPAPPRVVATLDTPQAQELAVLGAVFDDLQYVLLCCEHLVTALNSPSTGPVQVDTDAALVEALWTGALVGYSRCFAPHPGRLTDEDVAGLGLDGEVETFHASIKKLRDLYASRHVNPRESLTIGVALTNEGAPHGVAVVSSPQPSVDDPTVRTLGRIAYGLSGLVDARMAQAQQEVLQAAATMPREELRRLPQVQLAGE